ncbi:hypothetical protein BN1221_00575 [Brenneria goodwinii]|uniref:Uncharacterized protein n=1 Tax=Brenneria goodwinii TaxID=1109412 RepID=A0A0G4JQL3_9GAMM|nr:hypothetical protein BN1221_00575 [Brenneria goodwinii]
MKIAASWRTKPSSSPHKNVIKGEFHDEQLASRRYFSLSNDNDGIAYVAKKH